MLLWRHTGEAAEPNSSLHQVFHVLDKLNDAGGQPHPKRLGSFSVSHRMLGRLKVVGPNAIALQDVYDRWELKVRKGVSKV